MEKELLLRNLKRIRNLGFRDGTTYRQDNLEMRDGLQRLINRISKEK